MAERLELEVYSRVREQGTKLVDVVLGQATVCEDVTKSFGLPGLTVQNSVFLKVLLPAALLASERSGFKQGSGLEDCDYEGGFPFRDRFKFQTQLY